VDAGLANRVTSTASQALRDAHRRMQGLERELALVKNASDIQYALAVVDPKGDKPAR